LTITDLAKIQKDRIHPLIRTEISKVAESIIKYQTTQSRLRDLQEIEDPENKEEVERLRRTIRDTETMIELLQQDMEILESIKEQLES
jgi:hypothetical protein